jgi:signal transduction histidine kinase
VSAPARDRAPTTVRDGALGWIVLAGGAAIVTLLGALMYPPVAVVGAVLLVLVVVALLVRVVQPVRSVTRDVNRAANETLPAAADGHAGDAVEPITTSGSAEVVDLAAAVTSLQTTALALVAEQQRGQRSSSELTAQLGRRNQSLLNRLTTQVGELTTIARDPVVLGALDRLDHLVARTRRNAESTLVLTGAAAARTGSRPATVVEVLRAALAQVEDHTRVDLQGVERAAVSGSAVADLAHLVAELVENATHFSPPGARVRVTGDSEAGAYAIRITDHGVGMPADELDEANRRLRGGAHGPSATKLIGLAVVARLAARHGITVALASGTDDGLVATVMVPEKALIPLAELSAPRRSVTALAAAAAFIPPRPLTTAPAKQDAKPRSGGENTAHPEKQEFVRPGVPRRIRGAQLPDLGPDRDDGPHETPDAGQVRGRLGALQAGLSAARTNNIPPLPRPQRSSIWPRPAVDSPPAAPASSASRPVDDADES